MQRLSITVCIFLSLCLAQLAFGEEIKVSIIELRPTQPAAGLATTDIFRKSKYQKTTDMAEFLAKIIAENPLRAVRGPGGEIFLTDGHHRALGVFRTAMERCESAKPAVGVEPCMKQALIRVNVEDDLSSKTWTDFVAALKKNNNIYLPSQLWAKIEKGEITYEQIFKKPGGIIPDSLGKLANDTIRSALGSLFSRQKFNVDGNNFINYLEFYLADKIADRVKIEPGQEFDPDVQINLARAVFYTPEILKYFRCLARSDDFSWEKAQVDINLALRLDANVSFDQSNCERN